MKNREIRFRAWDKDRKEMGIVEAIDFSRGVDIRNPITKKGWYSYFESGNVVLMQDTGLKDKNGQSIWEGDIVRFKSYGKISFVFWHQSKAAWCLVGKEEFGDIYPVDTDYFHEKFETGYNWGKTIEVIGNIWENPDLLEDKK